MFAGYFTGASFLVKKFSILIVFFILIITGFLIWKYEQFSKKLPINFSKIECKQNIESADYIPGQHDYDSSSFMIITKPKPWYLENGTRYPEPAKISKATGIRNAKLLPDEDPGNDRILNQMMFVPPNYNASRRKEIIKKIYSVNNEYSGNGIPRWWRIKSGESVFVESKCPVDACTITGDPKERKNADLVLFYNRYDNLNLTRPTNQLYAIYYTEPPSYTRPLEYTDVINWTISYRSDSTIVAPYNRWVYYDPRIKQRKQDRNYAKGKTKKVAWFVSHCITENRREDYARELQKYIQVDIYGRCGPLKCSCAERDNKCFQFLDKDYKFYLSFENSNCLDYITEKFFDTGLRRDVVPIVMGAPRETYEKYAPHRSYIHVEDFESPKQLAEYLHVLDKNDDLYNSYFKWRGTGEWIGKGVAPQHQLGHFFFCRICAMLHDEHSASTPRWYRDINAWQRPPGDCTKGFWKNVKNVVNNH